jgi:hypothetical protein
MAGKKILLRWLVVGSYVLMILGVLLCLEEPRQMGWISLGAGVALFVGASTGAVRLGGPELLKDIWFPKGIWHEDDDDDDYFF